MNRELERRQQARVAYDATIYWAEYESGEFPDADEFSVADTNDLSPLGLSFFCDSGLNNDKLLIALTDPRVASRLLAAKVVECKEGFWERERRFRVGCQLACTIDNYLLGSDTEQISQLQDKLDKKFQSA